MDFELGGKCVVVTGGARGQGAAEVAALAAAGADVIAVDVADDAGLSLAASLAERCAAGQGMVTYRHLDVSRQEAWTAFAGDLRERQREVHGLVNNAGVAQRSRIGEIDLGEWNDTIAVNLTGTMLGMQALAPLMRPGASIVNVGSVAALGSHHGAAYTAAKWAVRGLTRSAATELGRSGIRVNVIHPGLVHTPLTASAPPAFIRAHLSLTPLARPGEAGEIAQTVLFLLSSASSYLTGAEIAVDGGYSAHGGGKLLSDAARG